MYIICYLLLSLRVFSSVIVGIVDSGIDPDNKFLKSKIIASKNFVEPELSIKDYDDHGTPIAGIITTVSDTDLVVAAVCNECGISNYLDIYDGIKYCINNQAFIVNLSLSFYEDHIKDLKTFLGEDFYNHFFVIAAGNDNQYVHALDEKFANVIFVAALSENGLLASYSNHGEGIDLAVLVGDEGYGLLTYQAYSDNKRAFNGTSAAAAVVSGYIAKIKEENPQKSISEIRQILFDKCYKNPLVLVDNGYVLFEKNYLLLSKARSVK